LTGFIDLARAMRMLCTALPMTSPARTNAGVIRSRDLPASPCVRAVVSPEVLMPADDGKAELARKERLAAALRANLRRRKAQERGRRETGPESGSETQDQPADGSASDGPGPVDPV
jgi:hypothetical protein